MTPAQVNRRLLLIGAIGLAGAGGVAWLVARPAGYGAAVDYVAVLGPPPVAGSATAVAERAAYERAAAGIGGAAWREASRQVFQNSPEVQREIACVIGRHISPATTPVAARLIGNATADLRRDVEAAKDHFARDRPFVGAADPRTCDPRTLGSIGSRSGGTLSYSYPSGHAADGRMWARVLGAAVPDRAAAIAAWGDRLGANRIVCRVHWPSDVAAGRRLADAVYARLGADPRFRSDVAAARVELANAPVARGC